MKKKKAPTAHGDLLTAAGAFFRRAGARNLKPLHPVWRLPSPAPGVISTLFGCEWFGWAVIFLKFFLKVVGEGGLGGWCGGVVRGAGAAS